VTITTREYDTDKPVDPITGTPPLKRETTETRRRTDTARLEYAATQTVDRHRDSTGQISTSRRDSTGIRANVRGQEDLTARIETREKRGLNTAQRVSLVVIGALTILAGLVWLGRKLLKRFL
jgi:hypothetical protein